MLEHLLARDHYYAVMDKRRKAHPPAKDLNQDHCARCGLCCWRRPPQLLPEDVTRLAAHFCITEEQFFARFCVVDDPSGIVAPVLIRAGQEHYAGWMLPDEATYDAGAPCVFLMGPDGNTSCAVNHCKPAVCASQKCWVETPHVAKSWTADALAGLGYKGELP